MNYTYTVLRQTRQKKKGGHEMHGGLGLLIIQTVLTLLDIFDCPSQSEVLNGADNL